MFTAKVYRVMLGSLSGPLEEVHAAKEAIRRWNQQNSHRTGKVFLLIEWTTEPEAVQNADIVVGIVDNWVSNPQFIEDCIDADKQVVVFFNSIQDSTNTISEELQLVHFFMNRIKHLCYCTYYNGIAELASFLTNHLDNVE